MEKSHQSTKQYFPFHTYLSPTTSSEDLEKGYALSYGDEPFPTEDAWRTRFKAVRPTVEARGDGTVVLGTSFEDAVPKEFTVILTKDEETDGDGKGEGVEDVGPEDSDAFNLYSDAESKDEIDYEDEVVEDVKMKGAGGEGGKEKEKEQEKDSVSYLTKKRLSTLASHTHQKSTLHTQLTSLSPSLPSPTTLPTLLADPSTKHTTMSTELTLYYLALKARKWAHRSQALEEEMAFAQTDEGKKKDEETMKVLEKQWEERKKAKKERKRVTRSAAKGEGRVRMGRYEVSRSGDGKGRGRGRGGKGDRRGRGRGGKRDRGRGGKGDVEMSGKSEGVKE